MMIVVPALAHCQNGDRPKIAAVVSGMKPSSAEYVGHRINGKGRVIKDHRADKKSPRHELKARCSHVRRKPAYYRPANPEQKR